MGAAKRFPSPITAWPRHHQRIFPNHHPSPSPARMRRSNEPRHSIAGSTNQLRNRLPPGSRFFFALCSSAFQVVWTMGARTLGIPSSPAATSRTGCVLRGNAVEVKVLGSYRSVGIAELRCSDCRWDFSTAASRALVASASGFDLANRLRMVESRTCLKGARTAVLTV